MGNLVGKPKKSGTTIPFVLGDWALSAGFYYIDLQHNLENLGVTVHIFDSNSDEVEVDRVNILNTNTIRIYTVYDPDCRFEGKANIITV